MRKNMNDAKVHWEECFWMHDNMFFGKIINSKEDEYIVGMRISEDAFVPVLLFSTKEGVTKFSGQLVAAIKFVESGGKKEETTPIPKVFKELLSSIAEKDKKEVQDLPVID